MVDYSYSVRPLTEEEGSGYLAEAVYLDECVAKGETIEEAVANLKAVITSYLKTI